MRLIKENDLQLTEVELFSLLFLRVYNLKLPRIFVFRLSLLLFTFCNIHKRGLSQENLILFLLYGSSTHKHRWIGITFVVEISLFALNVLAETNSIVYTFIYVPLPTGLCDNNVKIELGNRH